MAHKVVQQFDSEVDSYKYAISAIADRKGKEWRMLSMVIDTYDAWQFIEKYMPVHLVLRPDSGNTLEQGIAILKYKSSNKLERLSCIIGDDMDFERVKYFDTELLKAGLNPNDMTYGLGSGYYSHIDRNLLGFSMKTAFSNKKPRMKFSASGKTSLPGQVRLAYDENGRMKVYPYNLSKQNDDESTTPNLYEIVYFFDPLVPGNTPVIKHPHYEETWNRAQTVLHEIDKYTQEKIVVSDEILRLMKDIKQNYMPMTTRVSI